MLATLFLLHCPQSLRKRPPVATPSLAQLYRSCTKINPSSGFGGPSWTALDRPVVDWDSISTRFQTMPRGGSRPNAGRKRNAGKQLHRNTAEQDAQELLEEIGIPESPKGWKEELEQILTEAARRPSKSSEPG